MTQEAPQILGATAHWRPVSRFLIRSAGFPGELLPQPSAQLTEAIGEWRKAEARVARITGEFDASVAAEVGRAEPGVARKQAARVLYRWRRAVLAQRPAPPVDAAPPVAGEWAERWNNAIRERADAADIVARRATEESERVTASVLALAKDERFRAAVATSNPGLYEQALVAAGEDDPAPRRVRTLYAYLQRLCAKNESTSFFGPVDYGAWNAASRPDGEPGVRCTLAHWAVAAVAELAAVDPALRAALRHELKPSLALADEGRTLVLAGGDRRRLPALAAAQLQDVLAGASAGQPHSSLRPMIVSELEPPTAVDDPASWLWERLHGVAARAGDGAAASAARRLAHALDDLEERARAIGEHVDEQRYQRIIDLEDRFCELTGTAARRRPGDSYADRLCFNEKRRSAAEIYGVSAAESSAIIAELQPLLDLCYAYSVRLQSAITALALPEHAAMCKELGTQAVPLAGFALRLAAAVSVADAGHDPLVRAWSARLDQLVDGHTTDGRLARLDPRDLRDLCEPPPPGVTVSPDLMLIPESGAHGSEVPRFGQVVVGEIHHGAQVWGSLSTLDPELEQVGREVADAMSADGPTGQPPTSLIFGRTQGKFYERELPGGQSAEVSGRSAQQRHQVLRAADLTVVRHGDELIVVTPQGRPLALRPRHPRSAANWLFGPPPLMLPPLLAGRAAAPRVEIGRLVAWRRRWRWTVGDVVGLVTASDPPGRVLAAARLSERDDLPARVFARVGANVKPVYVDLRCPISLEHLAHRIRSATAQTIDVTEMLPEPNDWWLPRDAGRHSCEWRTTLYSRPTDMAVTT
jgi:hypothetical protein